MPKFILVIILLAGMNPARSQTSDSVYLFSYFKNNGQDGLHLAWSADGYNWKPLHHDSSILKPTAGKDKLMRDPCIIRGRNGEFRMVWTVSWGERGIGYAHSEDLVHWSDQQYLPVMAQEPSALNCWAPELFYDAKKEKYIIYWASSIPGRFPEMDSTGDNKYNHRIYYTSTREFTEFSDTKLLYDQGFNVIDATIQQAGNRYIMFLKDETRQPPQKNIRTAWSDELTAGYSKPSAPITGNYWAEGPTAIRIHNNWIVYFDKYSLHQYGALTSTDLEHWTDISDKISFPPGARHGSVFTVSKKEFDLLEKLLD